MVLVVVMMFTMMPTAGAASLTEAAAQLLEHLINRETTVTIELESNEFTRNEATDVYWEAVQHTGRPDAGDYIVSNGCAWNGSISGWYDGETYFLSLTYELSYFTDAEQEAEMDSAVDALLDELNVWSASDYERMTMLILRMTNIR